MEHQSTFSNSLSEEQISEIQQHAYDLLTWKDIAFLMDLPVHSFKTEFNNPNSTVYHAYQKGRVLRKKQLREPILKLAAAGSPQAEIIANDFLEEQLITENDDW